MATQTHDAQAAPKHFRLRTVALPAEHGSWGLALEPVLLGLLVAPSWSGLALAFGVAGLFLLRWPLKIAWSNLWGGKSRERFRAALCFAAGYALIALSGVSLSVSLTGVGPLWPFGLAIPFGVIFILYDWRNKSRDWQAELSAPIAFAATVSAITLAGGWTAPPALA